MSTQDVPFRLSPLQWLPADQFMLQEASKPFLSRLSTAKVVSHIGKHCLGSAPKTLVPNAIKRRYKTHFLGQLASMGLGRSTVEQADTMMELAVRRPRSRTPSALAEEIKKVHFEKSKSGLHTIEAIEMRYRTVFLKWADADEYMQWAAEASCSEKENVPFTIGLVVDYIKETFFLIDESTTRDDVENRYCKRWLKIESSAAVVGNYDSQLVQQAWSENRSTHPNNKTSRITEAETSVRIQSEATAWHTDKSQHPSIRQQHTVVGDTIQESPSTLETPSLASLPFVRGTEPYRHTHKRARPNSTDSDCFTLQDGTTSFCFPKPPPLVKLEKQIRDSGFFSTASSKDCSSLLSRLNRLSIDFALCPEDHQFTNSESPCKVCRFPERCLKPRVYLAPEYNLPQRAEDVDADNMDNGIMMTNANARR